MSLEDLESLLEPHALTTLSLGVDSVPNGIHMGSTVSKPLLESAEGTKNAVTVAKAELPMYTCSMPEYNSPNQEGTKKALEYKINFLQAWQKKCLDEIAKTDKEIEKATANLRALLNEWEPIYKETKVLTELDLGCANNLQAFSQKTKLECSNFATACNTKGDKLTTAKEVYDTLHNLFVASSSSAS